ncbi:MAG: HPF/RaiA family ribosome-associated protein [Dehalococcoidia bacterium]|nr:HPF/RaiA family ribosome-associated protein [Dehalococcoidia bacterium]
MTEVRIQHGDLALTGEARAAIDEAAAKLQAYDPEIQRFVITVDAPASHHKHGGPYSVHIDLSLPGKNITVSHQANPELMAAIHDAFDAARRQIEDYHRRKRDLARNA